MPPELEIHVILDNYGTHKTALIHRWLAKHPRYHLSEAATIAIGGVPQPGAASSVPANHLDWIRAKVPTGERYFGLKDYPPRTRDIPAG